MSLHDYFEKTTGTGVLATTDGKGNVNAAIYGRPHVMNDTTIAFIMADRLTHANLQSNPKAVYLFRESGAGYGGMRLYLTRTGEDKDISHVEALRRKPRMRTHEDDATERYLVYFRVDRTLPLVGSGER